MPHAGQMDVSERINFIEFYSVPVCNYIGNWTKLALLSLFPPKTDPTKKVSLWKMILFSDLEIAQITTSTYDCLHPTVSRHNWKE